MGAAGTLPFLMFAAGEPNRGDDGRRILRHFPRMRAFSILPPEQTEQHFSRELADEAAPWEFPIDVRGCVDLVLDLAKRTGRAVVVVDVNRPAERRVDVERWTTPGGVLPVLVAPTGARLEGLDAFTPGAVKRFLRSR